MNVYSVWKNFFGDFPPKAHLMREPLWERWLRIHSLPESKRYPENDQEYSELLERHHRVSCEILGEDEEAILFAPIWGENDVAPSLSDFEWASRAGLTNAVPVEFRSSEEDEPPIRVVGCPIRWSERQWDDLLRDVADDRMSDIVLLNPISGEVYAPYDGGADLFVTDRARVASLKKCWAEWLSAHPAGL